MDISTLLGKSWQQLTLEEQGGLAAMFGTALGVPVVASFTEEQQQFLSTLFLNVTGMEEQIDTITAQISSNVILKAIQTADGRWVIPASILTDPLNYSAYLVIVTNAPLVQLTTADFPQSEFPGTQ